jgi:hypothetical protein
MRGTILRFLLSELSELALIATSRHRKTKNFMIFWPERNRDVKF